MERQKRISHIGMLMGFYVVSIMVVVVITVKIGEW